MSPTHRPAKPAVQALSFKMLAGMGFVVVCIGLFAPRLIIRPETTADSLHTAPVSDGVSPGEVLLKMTAGVGVVALACIGLTRYLGKKLTPLANPTQRVEASLALDARCVVHLVRIGERRLLVGVDPIGVKAMAELPGSWTEPNAVIGPVRVSAVATPAEDDVTALLAHARVG